MGVSQSPTGGVVSQSPTGGGVSQSPTGGGVSQSPTGGGYLILFCNNIGETHIIDRHHRYASVTNPGMMEILAG